MICMGPEGSSDEMTSRGILQIALHILAMMEPRDLVCAALVSRYWRTLTEDHQLGKEKCQEAGVCDLGTPRYAGS